MAEPIITKDQMVARLGATRFQRAFDDNNDGTSDKLSWEQLARDASGYVRRMLGSVYDPDQLSKETSDGLTQVTLDVMEAMTARRRPTVMMGLDWVAAMKHADTQIADIRKGIANLGTNAAPEPAANVGATVTSGDFEDPEPKDHFALNGTGDF